MHGNPSAPLSGLPLLLGMFFLSLPSQLYSAQCHLLQEALPGLTRPTHSAPLLLPIFLPGCQGAPTTCPEQASAHQSLVRQDSVSTQGLERTRTGTGQGAPAACTSVTVKPPAARHGIFPKNEQSRRE